MVALQHKKLAERYVKILKNNIECKEKFCRSYISDTLEDVINGLPFAYKPNEKINESLASSAPIGHSKRRIQQSENPFKREELKIQTSFGLWVRTKSEMAIAEMLYSLGIEFYYEKGLTIRVKVIEEGTAYWTRKTVYPDFTIVLKDGSRIFWEHEGLLSKKDYNESNFQKLKTYSENGIYIPHNLILTSEGANNEIDMSGIKRIVEGWLMPLVEL